MLLVGACCSPGERVVQAPQALLTVVDGTPLLGISIEDLDRVRSDPHCGGSIELRSAAILMLHPDASTAALVPFLKRDLADGPSHRSAPRLTGIGLASPENPVAVFGDVDANPQGWSEDSSAPLGVSAVTDGDGLVLLAHRHSAKIDFGWEKTHGLTGWSPSAGAVWSHGGSGNADSCDVLMDVRASPNGRYGLMVRDTVCASGRTRVAQTLTTADGAIYGTDYEVTANHHVPLGGIADDGSSLVFSRNEERKWPGDTWGWWLHRSPDGEVLARLTERSIAPTNAYAWADDWLVQDANGDFTLFDRSGEVLATTRVEDIRDVQVAVTNDGLWVLTSPPIANTYCLTQYDRNLEALAPICLGETELKAAFDDAK